MKGCRSAATSPLWESIGKIFTHLKANKSKNKLFWGKMHVYKYNRIRIFQ